MVHLFRSVHWLFAIITLATVSSKVDAKQSGIEFGRNSGSKFDGKRVQNCGGSFGENLPEMLMDNFSESAQNLAIQFLILISS